MDMFNSDWMEGFYDGIEGSECQNRAGDYHAGYMHGFVRSGSDIEKTSDYLNGACDCLMGEPAKADQHPDYYRGYGYQYQHEQNMGQMRGVLQ